MNCGYITTLSIGNILCYCQAIPIDMTSAPPGQCGCLFFPNFQLALIKIFFEFIGNNFYPPEILPVPSLNRRSKRANWFPFHSLFTKGGKRMKSKLCTFFRPLLLLLLSDGVSYPTNRISVSWFLEVAHH